MSHRPIQLHVLAHFREREKQKKILCKQSIRITLNEESRDLQFLAPK